jgi:putative solute:sodium symporter small subunit
MVRPDRRHHDLRQPRNVVQQLLALSRTQLSPDLAALQGETVGDWPMMDRSERRGYWRQTKRQMAYRLIPLLAVLIIAPLYADKLNSNKFLGFPLGFFLVGHGLIVVAVLTVALFVRRQDAIDHWHGAHEDM